MTKTITAYPKSLLITAPNGDHFEAVKAGATEAWDISWPEGSARFHGTETELRAEVRRLITSVTA